MFKLEDLSNDKELQRCSVRLLSNDFRKLGTFLDISKMDDLLERLSKASYEKLKYLPKSKLTIFRTQEVGLGFIDYMSLNAVNDLMGLNKIDKDTNIYLRYQFGNVFAYLELEDIRTVLTDELYLFVNEENKEIWNIKIGKPTNANNLYYQNNWDNIFGDIKKIKTISGLNSVFLTEKVSFKL